MRGKILNPKATAAYEVARNLAKPLVHTGDVVYVKEQWFNWLGTVVYKDSSRDTPCWLPAKSMPESAARYTATIESVQCVAVQDVLSDSDMVMQLTSDYDSGKTAEQYGSHWEVLAEHQDAFQSAFIKKHGKRKWAANVWIWYYTYKIQPICQDQP